MLQLFLCLSNCIHNPKTETGICVNFYFHILNE